MAREFKNVVAFDRPKEMEILGNQIFISKNIEEIMITMIGEEPQPAYKYDQTIYTVGEYIQHLAEKNQELEAKNVELDATLTDTQMALCDLYEMLEGGM